MAWKAKFLDWIEGNCQNKTEDYKVKESPYYNARLFKETMLLIENYYKLDGKLRIIKDHTKL